MLVTFKVFDKLPEEAKFIRTTVFVDEQGFIDEFDESDNQAIHILLFLDDKAVGTSRVIFSKEHNCYAIGRFAILKEYRKLGLGNSLLQFTEEEIVKRFGHVLIGVSSQMQASEFYAKNGYNHTEPTYFDQHCLHVWMVKQL